MKIIRALIQELGHQLQRSKFFILLLTFIGLSLSACSIEYADPYYGYHDEEKNFSNQGLIATMNQGGPFVRHPRKPERWKDLPVYTAKSCDFELKSTPRSLKKFEAQVNQTIPEFSTHWQQNFTQLRIEVPQSGIFYVDAPHLRPDAYPRLDLLAALIKDYWFKVNFVGHTDDSGPEGYNQTLSGQRALHLQRYFVLKGLPQYLSTNESAGELSPIASNKTKIGRKKNRRVSMIFCTINKKS